MRTRISRNNRHYNEMNFLLLAVMLCSKGAQVNLLSRDDGSAPKLPRYIASRSKRIEWVFLGAGRMDLVWKDLIARHYSFMIVPWLLWPSKAIDELKDVIATKYGNDGEPPWDGLAVDRSQLADMQRYLSHLASVQKTFKLVSIVDQTCRIFPAPSDHEMLDNFVRHRSEFETIAEMAKTDHDLRRIDLVGTVPDDRHAIGVSPTRAQEYRRLFDKATVPRGIVGQGDRQFELIYWTYGTVSTESFDKSYVHLKKSPKGLLRTTDGYEWEHREQFEVFRHIEGDWYLSLSHSPK